MPLPQESALLDECALIAQAGAGSHDALAALFRRYGADVQRVAYRLTMSADEADDVVQDVFIGLPETIAAYGGTGDFGAWLRKVSVRTTLVRMRSGRRRAATAIRASALNETAMNNFVLDRMAIATALAALPSDLRIVFILRDI
jgi:RNA polymerase sigma-70 factor, ECF subfamily